jgi:uncharacterized damage-inducible protein DinB
MKVKLSIPFILLAFFMGTSGLKAQGYFFDQFPEVWKRNMDYSLALAEAMPANLYDYRPTPEAMSFEDQLLHIVDNISSLTSIIIGERKNFYKKEEKGSLDKASVIDILQNANTYVLDLIKESNKSRLDEKVVFRDVNMTKENIFYLLRGHQVHHRGQCLVYLRINGVEAPGYVGW